MMETYAYDHELPPLPILGLNTSCVRFLAMVTPLIDEKTLEDTRKAVADFIRPNGHGEILQDALQRYKDTLSGNASWLRPFWDDMYSSWRGRLPLEVNYAFRFDSKRWGDERALSHFVFALASVFRKLAAGTLEPEQSSTGFLSMEQAGKMLYTRIPADGADTLMPVKHEGQHHIAVACRGHWFLLPLLRNDGSPQSEETLHASFAHIRAEAASLPPAPCVSAFTAAPGDDRVRLRGRLQQSMKNRLNLKALENTLFAVCLDGAHTSESDVMRHMIAGEACNRWFTKSLQIIATENGAIGANFEHAGCDAAIWVYMLRRADSLIREAGSRTENENFPGDEAAGTAEDASLIFGSNLSFRRLEWEVSADLHYSLMEAEESFTQQSTNLQVVCHEDTELSRDNLKDLGTSPDAFLQIAFQAAQYQIFGKLFSSYEAVAVRGFAYGRTECARGCTAQALAFAKALGQVSEADCRVLYREAEQAHLTQLVQCLRGEGAERHMYGLFNIYKIFGDELGIKDTPPIFTDPGWLTLRHDTLSTSGIGAPFIRYFGFGPVVADGLGIGYTPSNAGVGLAITSNGSDPSLADEFAESFARTVGQITALLHH